LAARLAKQWQVADIRELRLLSDEAWPLCLPIGRPTAAELTTRTEEVRAHLQRWRSVTAGEVLLETLSFRGGAEPVQVPVSWRLRSPQDWVAAAADPDIQRQYERLRRILSAVDPVLRRVIVRQRAILSAESSEEEVIRAAEIAMTLAAGCALGRPLRALSSFGVDSKFFERHRGLMIQLLDARFDGQVSDLGLEGFLGAPDEGDHWLLVAPLEGGLLPFEQQRVRASELQSGALPGSHLLLVENEKCLYQLPSLANTVAVLGAGLHLEWLTAVSLREKRIGYWGDMDTWGLTMLGKARTLLPDLTALMMNREVFDACSASSVPERAPAGEQPPEGLTTAEREFYAHLRALERGRLEQEFVPPERARLALEQWRRK
jgi:hypothetical protein